MSQRVYNEITIMKKLFGIFFITILATTGGSVFALSSNEVILEPPTSTGGTTGGAGGTSDPMIMEIPVDSSMVGGAGGTSQGKQLVNTMITNPIKYNTFYEFVEAVLKVAVQILMPFVILAFVYSGFLFVKAQGNETELASAKKAIGYSVLGAFILLGAWAFAKIIGTTVTALTP